MSDRFQTEIEIGGTLSASSIVAFIEALAGDGLQTDWAWGLTPGLDDVLQANPTEPLHLVADEGEGEFLATEHVCREFGLSYRRTMTGKLGIDSGISVWRPGMDLPRTSRTDQHGYVALSLDELRAASARSQDLQSLLVYWQPLEDPIPPFTVAPVEADSQGETERRRGIEELVALEPTMSWRDRDRLAGGEPPLTLAETRAEIALLRELD